MPNVFLDEEYSYKPCSSNIVWEAYFKFAMLS